MLHPDRRWLLPSTAAYVVVFAWITRHYYVDDAYIGFQFLQQWLTGNGFVFHPGQPPVEGVTNIGWLLLLAPLSLLVPVHIAAKGISLLLLLAISALLLPIAWQLAPDAEPAATVLPLILLLSSFEFLYFPLAGMETAWLAFLLLLMARAAGRSPRSSWLPLFGALAFLAHPEAVLIYPGFVLLAWLRSRSEWRRWWRPALLYAALLLLITAVRWQHFGALLPNTFAAKPSPPIWFLANLYGSLIGANVNLAFPYDRLFPLLVPFWLFAAMRLWRARSHVGFMLLSGLATGITFAIYALPDWTDMGRYMAPYLPAAALLFWLGATDLFTAVAAALRRPRLAVPATAVLVLLLAAAGVGQSLRRLQPARLTQYPGYVLVSEQLVAPSLWIRANTPPDAVIATRRIGAVSYFAGRRIFDYEFGLTEPDVAAIISARGAHFAGPADPDLSGIWQEVAPDYLLEDASKLVDLTAVGTPPITFTLHGLTYAEVARFPLGPDDAWVLAARQAQP